MLYQSYKEKLNKRRLMFDRIWKFRLLILAGLLIALAAVGAMLGIKGIVSDFTISESFTYGNPLNPSANCIFGKAGFEYREVGESEWTDEAPVLAGEYECRPTGRTIVGSNRTGDIKTFTIEPIDTTVTVVEDHLVYGEVPEFSAKLQYSDVLSVDNYSLERSTKDRVEIEFSAEDIRILSADGDDVTASYNITAVDKTLTASLRPVTVETPSASYVYDGQVHGTEGAEITSARGLVKGHKLEISTISEYDKVGTYANSVQSMRIVDENGEDVSEWYNLTVVTGTLQITKRPITVGAELEDIVYDGRNHVYDQLQLISGSLAKGQQFSLTNYRTARDVGTYANTTDIVILDENGNNVNSNYSITRNFPTMKIVPRPLSVSTQSAEFTYDGLDHIYNTVDIAADVSLAQGQEIHYMNPIYCKAVGEYDISPSFRIWDENGYDVTGNYAITRNFGKVKILPRKIKVTTDSEDFVYDGKYHNYDKVDLAEGDGLASEQDISCGTITCRDVGEYDISPSFSILDALGYNVTNNYEITREFGKVTIRPLAINLGTPSFEYIYDGEEHKYSEIDIAEGYRLAENQKINIDKTIVCENVGTYDNSPSFRILDNNNSDVTKNYAIIRNFGKITIQQKKLVIKTKSDTIYYDGLEHRYDYGAQTLIPLDGTSLASGDMFSFTSYPTEMTKANETGYINSPAITIRSGGRDVSSNYDFSVREYGTIKIMRRNLEVTTGTASELIYNGGPQSCEDFDVNATDSNGNGLAAGQRIEVVGATSRTDCCNNVKNELQVQILDSSGRDVAENYNAIQWTYGTITINPRPISFNILGDSWIYDGQSHSIEQLEPINIVSGHTFTFKRASALPTITDVGSKINSYTFGDVQIFESGRDVTSNYTIDTVEKSVEDISVTPRAVTLKTGDLRVTYDAVAHSERSYTESANTLVSGHKVVPKDGGGTFYSSFVDAAIYPNTPIDGAWKVVDAGGNDVTRNYNITWVSGEIEIKPRPITIVTGSDTVFYDAQQHSAETAEVAPDSPYQLVTGHTLSAEYQSWVDVPVNGQPYENVPTSLKIMDKDSFEVTGNYALTCKYGTVTINKRPLTVNTHEMQWVYDDTAHNSEKDIDIVYYRNTPISGHNINYHITPRINAGEYEHICSVTITDDYSDVTANYDITYNNGTITIDKRPITVKTADFEWTYDGKSKNLRAGVQYKYFNDEPVGLDNHYVALEYMEITEVGEYDNNCSVSYIYFSDTENNKYRIVTSNYEINLEKGHVTVNPRKVLITTSSNTWVYEAGKTYFGSWSYEKSTSGSDRGLLGSHNFTCSLTSLTNITDSDTEVKYVENVASNFRVTAEGGITKTQNYEFEYNFGQLRLKSPIVARISSRTKQYDGKPVELDPNGYKITKKPPDIQLGDISIVLNGSLTYPGAVSLSEIRERSECSATSPDNIYRIDFIGAENIIEITKRKITVKSASIVEHWDGETDLHGIDAPTPYWVSRGTLLAGHEVQADVTGYLSAESGFLSAENTLENVKIVDTVTGADVTEYYDISCDFGELTWNEVVPPEGSIPGDM